MRRYAPAAVVVLSRLVMVALASGCGARALPGVLEDAGPPRDLPPPPVYEDMAPIFTGDLGGTGGIDMAVPQWYGKMLAGSYLLYGITDDNQVIASDLVKNNALIAVPADGNTFTTISAGDWRMLRRGRAVFDWEGTDPSTNVGKANVWTATGGLKALPSGDASCSGLADASPDGNWIVYSGGAAVDGLSTDLYVARSDGTGSIRYATSALVDPTRDPDACSSSGTFTASNKLLSIVCGKTNVLVVVNPATGQANTLSGGVDNWVLADPLGRYAAASDPQHKLFLFPLDGAAPIVVDTDVARNQAVFVPDGSALIYVTNGGKLRRATVGNAAAPSTLVAQGVTTIRRSTVNGQSRPALSPDGKWIVVSNSFDDGLGTGDLFLASTTIAGAPTTLVANGLGAIFGDAFSQDSRYALYFSETAVIGNGLVGTLNARLAGGGAEVRIASKVWVCYGGGGGSTIGLNDTYKSAKNYGRADLNIIDVSAPGKIVRVSPQAEAEFFPTLDRKKFVYSTTVSPATSGIYWITSVL